MSRRSHIAQGQAGLDFTSRARTDDPDTSKAAGRAAGATAQAHYALILEALREHGPGTYHEIAGWTWLPPVSVGRRMGEMQTAALVERTTFTRPSPAGCECAVWELNHKETDR